MNNTYAEPRIKAPHRYYETPDHILKDRRLSYAEQRQALETMRADRLLLTKATAENMTGGKQPDLRAVELALQNLDERGS
jgi:hypothetical protein